MKSIQWTILIGLSAIFLLVSCDTEPLPSNFSAVPVLPEQAYDYVTTSQAVHDISMPDMDLVNSFSTQFAVATVGTNIGQAITQEVTNNDVATLGRVLFYDGKLSKNNATACASCHNQSKAFSDGSSVSTGFEGRKTTRNSLAFQNLSLGNNFFWDSRQRTLKDLIGEPIVNHIEMGIEDLPELMTKLSNTSYYPELFEKAYGTNNITQEKFVTAISEFLASITTTNSTYDRALENDFEEFSSLEKLGMAIFYSDKALCGSCHTGANFAAPDAVDQYYNPSRGTTNIGLDLDYADEGRVDGFGGEFKIPSLRNIALTAPYMHDGRYQTLREVLDHYNTGIKPHPNLDFKLQKDGQPVLMNLSSLELDALEAFMHTLTDQEFLTNPAYSNPFEL